MAKLKYDRTVSQPFLEALAEDGIFHPLIGLAREKPLLDLQLRGQPGKSDKATLYYGLTGVLNLFRNGSGEFHLDAPETHKKNGGFSEAWAKWQIGEGLVREWRPIASYVRSAVGEVHERWTRSEGTVQASLESTRLINVIDREMVMGFEDIAARRAAMDEVSGPYLRAMKDLGDRPDWWREPSSFGKELDLLCLDHEGRVLLVELKPGLEMKGITWAPAQVGVYADLFERWAAQSEVNAGDVLQGMLVQRQALGLSEKGWNPKIPLKIVPVIGIGGEVAPKSKQRLMKVQETLIDAGCGRNDLEVWEFGVATRRDWRSFGEARDGA